MSSGGFDPVGGPPAWIYRGAIRHRRHDPVPHTFQYRLFELFLDVERLQEVFAPCRFWSYERPNVASFRRRDYLGDPAVPLADAFRAEVARLGGPAVDGPVWMLTHLRYFGYCFNPVTFYYGYSVGGELRCVLAEITNTPWLERHRYLVTVGEGQRVARAGFGKEFHVSPFFGMDQTYSWRFSNPGDRIAVTMHNHEPASAASEVRTVFDATLSLRRYPWNAAERARTLFSFPMMTAKVWLAIHWQAVRLWLKKVPVQPHPKGPVLTKAPGQSAEDRDRRPI